MAYPLRGWLACIALMLVRPFPGRCRHQSLLHALAGILLAVLSAIPSAGASLRDEVLAHAPGLREIVFAVRKPGKDGHWYANFGYYGPDEKRPAYLPGGRLCKLDLQTGKVTDLINDKTGGVRDPVINHDATRIIFSWRKGGEPNYHLWECGIDGSGMRQLTDGPWDDIEPCILPDDSIIFVSSRAKRWVNCWLTQVATLHHCDPDGGGIESISTNIEHDNTPWPLPDGRILYQRWEYIDRSQVDYHHLWTANPDGTNHMVYYGNQKPGVVMIDAKPIPNSDGDVVAIFSPGHGQTEHAGRVAMLNPRLGPDDPAAVRIVADDPVFRDPWPLSPGALLIARKSELLVMNGEGQVEIIHSLTDSEKRERFEIHEPRPVMKRPREKMIPPRVDSEKSTGRLVLANILEGRNMQGVQPGEIKKLLVMEPLPKPINYTGGMDPLSYGGSFTLERILGTVPVESDGSAYIELPARRNFFFVGLDENDLSVKRMQSFTSVQPGETTSCVGCHEQRTMTTLPAGSLLALQRKPSIPVPEPDIPQVFDFPRDIQPVLNKACANCHGYDATADGGPYDGGVILTGDHGPMFSHSYFTLTTRRLFSDGRDLARSEYPPRALGSSASRLLELVDGSHHGAKVTPLEKKKLRLWIEAAATYPGTYAALGTGMIGGYQENEQIHADFDWPATRAAAAVIDRRCASCHSSSNGPPPIPRALSDERGVSFWRPGIPNRAHTTSRHIVFNLSRPAKSLLLLAPLSRTAGGLGLCHGPENNDAVFQSGDDPDYGTLLSMINAGKDYLNDITRFDMTGFKPHPAYVREMKRFGILPAALSPDTRIDPYAIDQLYWKSLWHQPSEPKR